MATATKAKKKSSKPTITVIFSTFDASDKPVYRNIKSTSINNWKPINQTHYIPYGGTPLRDATAKFIEHLDELKKPGTVVIGCLADESGSMEWNKKSVIDGVNEFVGGMKDIEVDPDSDGKVLAVILTDGLENSSREVSPSDLQELINQKESEDFTFIYLGANQDAWDVGRQTGFSGASSGSTINYAGTPIGTQSSLRTAGVMANSYLSSNATYDSSLKNLSTSTINEDGSVEDIEGNQYKNVQEAINKGKESTK